MRVVDFHAHIYPDKIAQKASVAIGDFYDITMRHDGTVSALLDSGDKAGIGTFVVHSVATVPQQVEAINDFLARTASEHPGRLIGFATMHPDYAPIGREIDRVIALGLKGIKLHPDFQKFNIDSPEALRIFEAVEGRLPVLVHTGDFRYEYSKARRVASVVERFPKLKLVCAHFGGWSEWEEATNILQDYPILVDTSSSLYALTPEKALGIIRRYGADNVLFGSDYPMWGPDEELERFCKIGLSDEEREKILHGNAERLFGF